MPLANADSFKIPLRDKSVHCIITSTPYFGLRIYDGARPTVFGGRVDCVHEWIMALHNPQPHGDDGMSGNLEGGRTTQAQTRMGEIETAECQLCGAWRGFFGGEQLHDCLAWARGEPPCGRCFVCNFRELALEMWRVLRDDGTCWLVIGDCYAGGGRGGNPAESEFRKQATNVGSLVARTPIPNGLKPKDKVMIPERVRLALQSDGWYVRSVSQWFKRNSMPESVTDRPGSATEDIILLTKSTRYYYDAVAVKAPLLYPNERRRPLGSKGAWQIDGRKQGDNGGGKPYDGYTTGRNRRTTDWFFESLDAQIEEAEDRLAYLKAFRAGGMMVSDDDEGLPLAFIVNPNGYSGAHYATFPIDLVTPMILASTSAHGVCPKCGAQWERMIEKGLTAHDGQTNTGYSRGMTAGRLAMLRQAARERGEEYTNTAKTIGWRPTCACGVCDDDDLGSDGVTNHAPEPVPVIVLDPFVGSGTTIKAARQLGRIGIGFDVSMKYLSENALPRAERTNTVKSMQTLPLFQEVMA